MRKLLLILLCATSVNAQTVVNIKLTNKVQNKKQIAVFFQEINKRTDVIHFRFTNNYDKADVVVKTSNQYGHTGWNIEGEKIVWLSRKAFEKKTATPLVIFHELCHVFGIKHSDNPDSIMWYRFNANGTVLDSDLKDLEEAVNARMQAMQ